MEKYSGNTHPYSIEFEIREEAKQLTYITTANMVAWSALWVELKWNNYKIESI